MRFKYLNTAASFLIVGIAVSFLFAQTATPPGSNIKEAELVELTTLDKSIKLDIRYARSDNFVGRPVYDEARAFLQRPAADALIRVHKKLKKQGLGLVIFDGYRPWSVTKLFWEVTPEDKRKFVANPRNGSRHNRGAAVDLSIYDLKSGKALEMPSDFDDFSEKAHPEYKGGTEQQTKNRDLLKGLMEAEGFTVNANEWWHYDYKDWQSYGLYDIPFSTIGGQTERIEKAKIKEDKKLKAFFEEADITGGIYIYDLQKNRYTIYDRKRMDSAFSPASTSKIVHSLIFLDTGAVKDENEVLKWDGVKRSHEPANQDHTLRSAYKVSALWFFHDVSKRITRETMQRYYDGANYANRSTEGYGDTYWVKGNLAITPRQQIEFLVRLYENRLPFKPQTLDKVKDIMIDESGAGYVIRGKTGWSNAYSPEVGWWVGYVTKGSDAYFFATQIDIRKNEDGVKRKEITNKVLRFLKIIN